MAKPDYDTTIARVAGNLLSGVKPNDWQLWARLAVDTARLIAVRVKKTEPQPKGFDLDQIEGLHDLGCDR